MPERARTVSRPLVLIADDSRDTREMYAIYLSMLGYAVESAIDGHEAVIKARTLQPDPIVMDLVMPALDGWGAMREIRSRPDTATIPVIVLTGHDFKAYLRHSAIADGAVSFLTKPTFPEHLAREISDCLGQRQEQSSARQADATRRVARPSS